MISKIKLNFFQINLMLELFMCLMLKLVRIIFKKLLIRNNLFYLKCFVSIFWQFFCCLQFFLSLHYLPSYENSKPKRHVSVGGGEG